jgi:hypothetical protein
MGIDILSLSYRPCAETFSRRTPLRLCNPTAKGLPSLPLIHVGYWYSGLDQVGTVNIESGFRRQAKAGIRCYRLEVGGMGRQVKGALHLERSK